jgi:hypothetical protein
MKSFIKKLGITEEHMLSREQLKQITGGASADLHCRCAGGSVGCWYYPGTANGGGNDINMNQAIQQHCESGVGECAYVDSYCAYA